MKMKRTYLSSVFTFLIWCFCCRQTRLVSSLQQMNTPTPRKSCRVAGNLRAARLMAGSFSGGSARNLQGIEYLEREYFEEWGLEKNDQARATAPMTPDFVVDESFHTIAGTLNDHQKFDPAIASNSYSRSIFDHRPLRSSSSAGRIGIEIDGAVHLFPDARRISPQRAIRRLALLLAAKMASSRSWSRYENSASENEFRPVVLCFNTIKEALLASQEMQFFQKSSSVRERQAFDHVIIQSISDGLPRVLHSKSESKRRRRQQQRVDPTKGILMVVQPTDIYNEFSPPVQSINTITSFQKVIACAFLHQVPVVLLSPRFSHDILDPLDNSINQNSFQKAAYYGGKEPPKGPSPWVLRDFFPPSYCWITTIHECNLNKSTNSRESFSRHSLLTITNSVMDEVRVFFMGLFGFALVLAKKTLVSYSFFSFLYPPRILTGKQNSRTRGTFTDPFRARKVF